MFGLTCLQTGFVPGFVHYHYQSNCMSEGPDVCAVNRTIEKRTCVRMGADWIEVGRWRGRSR